MMTTRARIAGLLALGATILLISILAGTRLGDRVIVSSDGKNNNVAVDLPTPVPVSSASVPPSSTKWKKSHVVAVATDPAFPDPRLTPTPEPTPSPTPKPTPAGSSEPDDDLDPGNRGHANAPRPAEPPTAAPLRVPGHPATGRGNPTSDELGE